MKENEMNTEQENNQETSIFEKGEMLNAFEVIRKHGGNVIEYLCNVIAALCDVEVEEMCGNNLNYHISHARWLWWLTYRQLTSESYRSMASKFGKIGHKFTASAITIGINKMSTMVIEEPIWQERWSVLKKYIKTYNDNVLARQFEDPKQTIKIVISKPKNINVKIEYKND